MWLKILAQSPVLRVYCMCTLQRIIIKKNTSICFLIYHILCFALREINSNVTFFSSIPHYQYAVSPVNKVKVKVKFTLVQAPRLCTGRTAHRWSRGIALLFLDHGTRRGWGVSVTPLPHFNSGKDPVPIVQEAAWAPGPVRIGVENLASIGIRSPDRPARSQSLYRLSYRAHSPVNEYDKIYNSGRTRKALCLS